MKILFVAIVKNEEKVLERCLKSVEGIVDHYLICDTGSTDATKEIASKFGTIQNIKFINYASAKNHALEIADEISEDGDYILLLDADEFVESGGEFLRQYAEKREVDCLSTRIIERDQRVIINTYYRNRMWRAKSGWKFEGPGVHEVLCGSGTVQRDGRIIINHDHSHRTEETLESLKDRFLKYLETFQTAVKENPKDTRSWFYLANTHQNLNNFAEAIDAYEQYLAIPENFFAEERWRAAYDIALLWKSQGEYTKAFDSLKRAIQIDPSRAESFCLCGVLHYARQDWNAAIPFFEESLRRPFPEHIVLFIDPRQYHEIPTNFLCLCYYQTNQFSKAKDLSNHFIKEAAEYGQ
jgi:glycosyltransferase involved in cell wall biosynthesis